ncbi:MAG: methyl-accepting chemotaxis protein [Terriglobia bacterium]|nr:methyl-accepting chemotaxis protein [Terriglobia bacterium]
MTNLVKTIRAKLMIAIGALALVAAGLAAFGIYEVNEFNNRINFVTLVVSKRNVYANRGYEAFLAYYRFQKNQILETDPTAKQRWEEQQAAAETDLNAALGEWEKVASEEGKREVSSIRSGFADFKRENDRILALSRAKQEGKARELSNGEANRIADRLRVAFDEGRKLTEDAMQQQATETDVLYAQTRNWMVGITLLALGACGVLAYFIVTHVVKGIALVVDRIKDVAQGEGDLTKRIEVQNDDELGELSRWFNTFMDKLQQIIIQVAQSTEHIASAAEEISSTATQTSRSAITQKDQTTQVATAMQEMSSTVLQVSENASKAAESARRAGETARSGGAIVSETVDVIQNLANSTRNTSAKIEELGKSSDQIGQIIGVIDDIADQTNLLALNAAIEAARAGEQGRGFAVVADEVRKLAERTTQATKEIAQMIKTIQEETARAVEAMEASTSVVEHGVESATKAGNSLKEIIQSSEQVNDMITHIATASTEQSTATQQVNANMEQISSLVQESAMGAEQSAKACTDLSDLALDLQKLVGRFKLGNESTMRVQQRNVRRTRRPDAEMPVQHDFTEQTSLRVQ